MIPVPWTEEPGGLQPMVSQRAGRDQVWARARSHTHTHTHTHTYELLQKNDCY